MKVLVLDAGHATGHAVVDQALDAGHEVTALVRGGVAPPRPHERLEVVATDDPDDSTLRKAVLGKDAVISLVTVLHRRSTTALSDAAAEIVEAFGDAGTPRRVMCVSSHHVDADSPGWSPARRVYVKLIVHRRHRNRLNDMKRMEEELRQSTVDWTVVRPAILTDGPVTGGYRTATGRHVAGGRKLSRRDLGHYLVTHLDDPATYRQVIEIAN